MITFVRLFVLTQIRTYGVTYMRIITIASKKGGSGKTTLAGHLAVEADRHGSGHVAIIDTPPEMLSIIRQALAVADFVLIPARPSPHDLRAVSTVVEMVEEANKPF